MKTIDRRHTKMNRSPRWSPIPVALLALAITGCDGNHSEGAQVSEKPSQPEATVPATEDMSAVRTIVLHVTGMMKSKSGAT